MSDELDKLIDDLIKIGQREKLLKFVFEPVNKGSRRKRSVEDREYVIEREAKLKKKYEQEKWKKATEEQRKKEADHRRKRRRYLRPIDD